MLYSLNGLPDKSFRQVETRIKVCATTRYCQMTQDSSDDIDLTNFDESDFDIDETDLEIDEDDTELDNRGLVECRRFVGERRKGVPR